MLKKSWILLLLLTAALLAPCSEALALVPFDGPINGTWKFTSGRAEYVASGVTHEGTLDLNSVHPSEFEIRMFYEAGDDTYRLGLSPIIEVNIEWEPDSFEGYGPEGFSFSDDYMNFTRIIESSGEEVYSYDVNDGLFHWTEVIRLSSDYSTLTVKRDSTVIGYSSGSNEEYTLERVGGGSNGGGGNGDNGDNGGGNGGGSGDGGSSGGCDAGLGALALALILPAVGITRRRN